MVSASAILNLYNDVENLLTYTGSYIAQYQSLYAQYGSDMVGKVPIEELKPLIELASTIKVLIYRTHTRATALADNLGKDIPENLQKAFKKIMATHGTNDNLVLIFPDDLMDYTRAIYSFVVDATLSDLLRASKNVFKELGS